MNNIKQRLTSYFKGRNFPSAVLTAIVIAVVVFVNIIIYTLSGALPLYLYSPVKDDLSISSASDVLFEKYIEDGRRVTVTFCSYEDVVSSHDTGKFVLETAREFEKRYEGFISLRFVNAITKLDSEGRSVADELEIYQDGGNNAINDTSVIFSTDTSYRVLTDTYSGTGYIDFYTLDDRLYITSYNGEETFAASMLWALSENHGTAYMTIGHGETANGTLYNILTAAGYNVRELNLRKNDIPEDAELLIISNPISDFERGAEGSTLITEYDRLKTYSRRGGRFMVCLDPTVKALPVLEGFISEFGISFATIDSGERSIIKDSENAITTDGFTLVADFASSEIASKMQSVIRDRTGDPDGRVIIRGVGALVLEGNAMPILTSSSSSVLEADGETVNTDGRYTIAACSILENDLTSEAKMFVMSDGMLTASDAIVTDGYSNKDFLYSLFDSFFDKGDMPYGCRSIIYNEAVLENLTMGTAKTYTAVLLAIPTALLAVGAFVLVRRKNR